MAKTAADTDQAVRKAMRIYEAQVLNPKHYDPERDIFRFRLRISAADVLEIAKVLSRSTLLHPVHAQLRSDLAELISDLKVKTGKVRTEPEPENAEQTPSGVNRADQLAQTIAALWLKVRVLEKELKDVRAGREVKVTALIPKARGND